MFGKIVDLLLNYFYIPFTLFFIVGGIGIESIWIVWGGLLVFSLYLLFFVIKKGSLKFPPNFLVYAVVLVLFILNLSTTQSFDDTLKYIFLFFGGGVIWLFSFNVASSIKLDKYILWIVLFLGLFFSQYVVVEELLGTDAVKSFSITGFSSQNKNHHHIGDFVSLISTLAFFKYFENKERGVGWLAVLVISICFILFSQSRTAVVALGVSVIVIMQSLKNWKTNKLVSYSMLLILIVSVFAFAQSKSLFLSRPYLIQGLYGFANNPLGVGMGNFRAISEDPKNHPFGLDSFSVVAHNLPLEFLTGMGILGLVFVYFYIRVFYSVWKSFLISPISALVFINLSVSFFFDFTYAIPTMLWLWFLVLGNIHVKKS